MSPAVTPCSSKRFCTSGCFSTLASSVLMRWRTASGVPCGAISAYHVVTS